MRQVVAIGLGARGTEIRTDVIVAAVLGLAVATSFWLAYFDFFPIRAQQILVARSGVSSAWPSRAMPTPTYICRWSPASSLSHSR